MNLKLIDAAIAGYQGKIDAGDAARLGFFRTLWGVLDECARLGDDDAAFSLPAYVAPDVDVVRAACADGRPVFEDAPVEVNAELLSRTLGDLARAAVASGTLREGAAAAFERTKWDRVVRASDIALAGSHPSAWLADMADVLVDDGIDADDARLGALLASMALKVQLEEPARKAMAARSSAGAGESHPLTCPVCGSAPMMAHVGAAAAAGHGRGRVLVCPQCATAWEFERVRCARCGTRNQAHLHFFNVEGDDAHRIATCDECGGYIRTLYSEDALAFCSYEVEDVVMAKLDAIAHDPRVAGAGAGLDASEGADAADPDAGEAADASKDAAR